MLPSLPHFSTLLLAFPRITLQINCAQIFVSESDSWRTQIKTRTKLKKQIPLISYSVPTCCQVIWNSWSGFLEHKVLWEEGSVCINNSAQMLYYTQANNPHGGDSQLSTTIHGPPALVTRKSLPIKSLPSPPFFLTPGWGHRTNNSNEVWAEVWCPGHDK